MDREILIALFEARRLAYLTAFVQLPKNTNPALAYAYEHRIYPLFHKNVEKESYGEALERYDPFDSIYPANREFVEALTNRVDELWRAKNWTELGFYKLEDEFKDRMKIFHVLRYSFLADRFDTKTYEAIEADAPVEAHGIMEPYSSEEVELES